MMRFGLCMLLLLAGTTACAERAPRAPACTLKINEASWQIEVARAEADREKGLMHRPSLPENRGMAFVFTPPRKVSMWMKDTLVPLDMLFVDEKLRITGVEENAEPMSEDVIRSWVEVAYVLELHAGQAEKHRIKIGDKLDITKCPQLVGNGKQE